MRARFVAGPMFFVVLAGCQSESPLTPTKRSAVAASLAAPSLSQAQARTSSDGDFDDLVGDVPGFGGLFYDSTGTLTIYLKDIATLERSRATIQAHLARGASGHVARLSQVSDDVARLRVRTAKYDFRELRAWYRRHVIAMLAARGVTMTDIDEQRNRIVVGVSGDSFIPAMRARIAAADIPPDAIEIVTAPAVALGGPITPQSAHCDPAAIIECPPDPGGGFGASYTLRQTARPVVGGMQVAWVQGTTPFLCSLGFNAFRRVGGRLDSDRYYVTAGHCTDTFGSVSQMSMGQSTVPETIGQEFADPSYFGNGTDPACPVYRQCRRSDVSMFKYVAPNLGSGPSVAFPAVGSVFVTAIRQVAAFSNPVAGQSVHMIGRTSGHTQGSVVVTCVNLNVVNPNNVDTGRTLLCQDLANYASDFGDSGAPVVAVAADGSLVALGVHWGKNQVTGRAAISPISAVVGELNAAVNGSVIFTNP